MLRLSPFLARSVAPVLVSLARPVIELAAWLLAHLPITAFSPATARRHGVRLLRNHYYSPIPDPSEFGPGFWDEQSEMIGVDLRESQALDLLHDVFPRYLPEFRERFPIDRSPSDAGFQLLNGFYMAVDAHVYYSFIRHYKPRRVIEIGAGHSTLVAVGAAEANEDRDEVSCEIIAIEPHPSPEVERLSAGRITLVREKLQSCDLRIFQTLEKDDILFIDSSHVLREGNDVQLEYLEVLPRLKAGVRVHIHDISLPRRYPRVYFDLNLFWNEQYLLQAYLTHNSRMDVVWPGNYMMLRHRRVMEDTFPEILQMREKFPAAEPTAFWIRVRE